MTAPLAASLVARRALQAQLLAAFPELADDEQALIDTLDGLNDLDEQILSVLRHALEREAMAKALGEMMDTMAARKRRLAEGATAARQAALQAMQEAGMHKLAAPDMTVSVGAGKPKVLIVDEHEIPEALMRVVREPRKTDIAQEWAEGRPVDGTTLGNPQPFLTVHRR